ncbi:MAG: metal ABC transporter substrate-binding protein [Pseudomonadota bacterium]
MNLRNSILKFSVGLIALAFSGPVQSQSDQPTSVVATFSILGDMVARVGGEHISLTTLVGPNGDAHVYKPTPADARAVSQAQVLFVNGLEFEGWLDRLIDASDFNGSKVVTTAGVTAIKFSEDDHHDDDEHHDDEHHEDEDGHDEKEHDDDDHGDEEHAEQGHEDEEDEHGHHHGTFDPHAWQSLENAIIYIDNITAALAKSDPENASHFYQNRAKYVAELESLKAEISALMAAIPEEKRTVVTSHDAFGYFAASHNLNFEAPQGMSTESEASAQDVASLIKQIRAESVTAVFVETITDNRLLEQIARETGARIGGTLYSDALSGPEEPASTYVDMMRHNATTLSEALSPN